jgi:CIC family chloride channel protein
LTLRLIATTFCVGTGTIGGVFTPTIFAGGAVGYLVALSLHLPNPTAFAILSMGALLSAVTHAPLMSAFMTVELTGAWHLLPFILGSAFAALAIARRLSPHSLYAIATPEPTDTIAESSRPKRERWIQYEPMIETELAGTRE